MLLTLILIGWHGIEKAFSILDEVKKDIINLQVYDSPTLIMLNNQLSPKEDNQRLAAVPMSLIDLINLGRKRPILQIIADFEAAPFVIKHTSTKGELLGYHCDTLGTTSVNKKYAKAYLSVSPEKQIEVVRSGLEGSWKGNHNWGTDEKPLYFKDSPRWKGCGLEEILTSYEIVPELKNILIVENEERWLSIYKDAIPEGKANVFIATNLEDAEKLFLETPPFLDLIIMDACVDNDDYVDSVPLVKKIRENYSGRMLAASGSKEYQKELAAAGCTEKYDKWNVPGALEELCNS